MNIFLKNQHIHWFTQKSNNRFDDINNGTKIKSKNRFSNFFVKNFLKKIITFVLYKSNMDISHIPSPCYVLEESLLAANLELIADVGREADVEIILALKGFAMWGVFPLMIP